jgi:hypothetical protein
MSLTTRTAPRSRPEEAMMSTDTLITPVNPTLQHFNLDDLAVYTAEQAFGPTASPDFRVFYVGRDDVHGVLMHLFSRVSLSVKMNMFGYTTTTSTTCS